MDTDMKTAQHQDNVKKPYEAPKLVVMGDTAAMTRNTFGPGLDVTFPSEAVS